MMVVMLVLTAVAAAESSTSTSKVMDRPAAASRRPCSARRRDVSVKLVMDSWFTLTPSCLAMAAKKLACAADVKVAEDSPVMPAVDVTACFVTVVAAATSALRMISVARSVGPSVMSHLAENVVALTVEAAWALPGVVTPAIVSWSAVPGRTRPPAVVMSSVREAADSCQFDVAVTPGAFLTVMAGVPDAMTQPVPELTVGRTRRM